MFLRPAKKNLPPRHKNFVLRRKICAQKRAKFAAERKILFCAAKFARKNAQNRANGFAYHAAKNAELRAKKNFAPQTAQFARKQKFPKMETLFTVNTKMQKIKIWKCKAEFMSYTLQKIQKDDINAPKM